MGRFSRRLEVMLGGRSTGGSPTTSGGLLADAERVASAGSFECNLETGAFGCSTGFYTIFAAALDTELTASRLLDQVHPEDREIVEHAIERTRQANTPFSLELRIFRFDGTQGTVRARGMVLDSGDGSPARLIGTVQDVTEEAQSRPAREFLGYVVDSSQDAILTKTPDGTITSWNRAAERLYGYSAEEAIGASVKMLEPPNRAGEHEQMTRAVFMGEPVERVETERVRKDGAVINVAISISPVRDANNTIISAAVLARDITERVGYENQLRHLADHDQLTGLFNRRRFDEELRRELARATRSGAEGTLVVIDIDDFKAINDSHGHAAGDAALGHVAGVLRGRLRSTDVIARLGGDELGALLPDTGPAEAQTAAEGLRQALHAAHPTFGGKPLRITASIGVAAFRGGDTTADELLIHADLAMYAAKTTGRDRVVVYSPAQARAARSLAREPWSDRIRDALDEDSFVLHLQPIIDLATGKVSHGELLLRMRADDGRLIAPGAFLPTAERIGLIHQIDRWVVKRAIDLVARMRASDLPPVSVNLSGETVVGDPALLEMIERELEEKGADPSRLIFEVTETAALANMPDALAFTRGLIGMGCSLALDDFGTGFASFKYLKHLPVAFVKLDGEFIQNLPRSAIDEHVVRTIVSLARSLGIKTVAEAVTDDETVELLRTHSVDFAQGFHLGKPAPLPELARA
jgi:diguanylate cyclase (GGDEF)-like protein/PAS domain S-box-containing protein